MRRCRETIAKRLSALFSCAEQTAPELTAEEIYGEPNEYGGRLVEKIAIRQDCRVVDTIIIDAERWEGEIAVYLGLPYEWTLSWAADDPEEAFSAWEPLLGGGAPALVVQEHISGGTAPGSHRWFMRIFLWEDEALRELPAIPGAGEAYYFKDLNKDGTLEFVNHDGLSALPKNEDGIPISSWVYRFDGERYLPAGTKDAISGK